MKPVFVGGNLAVRAAKFTRTDEEVFCVCDPADWSASMIGSFAHRRLLFANLGVLDFILLSPLFTIIPPQKRKKEKKDPSVWKY